MDEIRRMVDAEKSDLFDVLAYIAYALSPITRAERVETRKKAFLDFVLAQYVTEGVGELAEDKLPDLLELKYHAVNDAAAELGGVAVIRDTFVGFQRYLYE